MSSARRKSKVCRYCPDRPLVREVDVVVGRPPGHPARLLIDVDPHPNGRVIERQDGSLRLLGDPRFVKPGIAAFRVHRPEQCVPRP